MPNPRNGINSDSRSSGNVKPLTKMSCPATAAGATGLARSRCGRRRENATPGQAFRALESLSSIHRVFQTILSDKKIVPPKCSKHPEPKPSARQPFVTPLHSDSHSSKATYMNISSSGLDILPLCCLQRFMYFREPAYNAIFLSTGRDLSVGPKPVQDSVQNPI